MHMTKGRPADLTGRAEREIRVYDLLDQLEVAYEYVDHEAAMTMEDCLEVDKILDAVICKNLFLCTRQKDKYFLLLMPGEKKFRTAQVSKLIGCSRLSFAREEDMIRLLDLTPGSVSVMGLMNDHENNVQLLIDEDVREGEYFACHPCMNTTSMRFPVKDLLEKILPAIHHEPVYLKLEEVYL